jgi:hypothetical protein
MIAFLSCTNKENDFDSFEYSYAGTFSTVFSIKFTNSDTIFLREHWNSGGNENIQFPKPETNYFAVLTKLQRNELSNLIKKMNFKTINSEYFENYSDGSAFNIVIRKGKFKKKVFVHSHNIPKELDSLSGWIYYTKMKLKLTEINKKLEFESAKPVLLPPPPPPPISK